MNVEKLEKLADEILRSSCSYEVFGSANSGKTSLALNLMVRAKGMHRPDGTGVNVATICSNRVNVDNFKEKYLAEIIKNNVQLVEKTINIRTIHSLCCKILLQYADYAKSHQEQSRHLENQFLTGPEEDVLIAQVVSTIIQNAADGKLELCRITPKIAKTKKFTQELRELIEAAENLGTTPDELDALGGKYGVGIWKDARHFYNEYMRLLDDEKKVDHVGTISSATEVLKTNRIDTELDILVVDDAEELSYSALNLIRTIMDSGTRVVLIGNPNEAVYDFRGSVINFKNTLQTTHKTARIMLDDEYAPNLVPEQAIMQHLQKFKNSSNAGVDYRVLRTKTFENLDSQIQYAIYEIRKNILELYEVDNQDIDYSKFAIIARSISILQEVKLKLDLSKIPTNYPTYQIAIKKQAVWKSFVCIIRAAKIELSGVDSSENIDEYSIKYRHKDVEQCYFVMLNQRTSTKKASERLIKVAMKSIKNNCGISKTLWNIWSAANISKTLRTQALNLSDINAYNAINVAIQIFNYANEYENRTSQDIYDFIEYYSEQNFSADNLYANTHMNGINLLTPASAKGKHFDHAFILELNDGIWPNLKSRDLLLRYTSLFDIKLNIFNSNNDGILAISKINKQKEVLNSELRALYVAITRTTHNLYIFSTDSEESEPSSFFQNARFFDNETTDVDNSTTSKFKAFDLQTLVYMLRLELTTFSYKNPGISANKLSAHPSATMLKKMFNMQIENTKISNWYYANEISSNCSVFDNGLDDNHHITISPSSVETLLKCPLRWFFERSGGNKSSVKAKIGTVVHEVLREVNQSCNSREETLKLLLETLRNLIDKRDLKSEFNNKFEEYIEIQNIEKMMAVAADYYHNALLNQNVVAKINGEELNEAKFEYKLSVDENDNIPLRFVGRIDRVEENNNGELLVVDWKTGKNKWAKNKLPQKARDSGLDENPQLLIYQMLLKRGTYLPSESNTSENAKIDKKISGGKLVYLGKKAGTLESKEYTQKSIDELPLEVDAMLKLTCGALNSNIFDTDEEANLCRTCELKYACIKSDAGKMVGQNAFEVVE